MNCKKYNQMMSTTILTNESGRSMVEMLGVLAIVGVLSVGGVYGYGVAMKKHKANELLHQASMLATTISAQAMTNNGALPPTITSFGNSSYGTFSTSTTDALDGKGFTITIEKVDSAVCDQLKEGGMVQGVECVDSATSGKKDAKITYYKNLATNEAEGEKSPTGGNGGNNAPETCAGQKRCDGGTFYYCDANGEWKSADWNNEKCNGDTYMGCTEGASYKCENGSLYFCQSNGFWEYAGDIQCDGNTYLGCYYGDVKCENGVFYRCTSSEKWEAESDNNSWCNGNTYTGCIEYDKKCENGQAYSCYSNSWERDDYYDVNCSGNTYIECDTRSGRCINGEAYLCESNGLWTRETDYDSLCDGNTYNGCIRDTEKCENGHYYQCEWTTRVWEANGGYDYRCDGNILID